MPDDVDERAAQFVDRSLVGLAGDRGERVFEVVAPVVEAGHPGPQVADALAAGLRVEGTGLERVQIPLESGRSRGVLLLDGGEFAAVGVVLAAAVAALVADRLGDEIGVGVQGDHRGENGIVEVVGG